MSTGVSTEPRPLHRDREWLHDQYVNRLRSTTEIGVECGVSSKAISKMLARFGIPARRRTGQNLTGMNKATQDRIARHAPRVGDRRAPSFSGDRMPVTGTPLLLRVDAGWVHDEARSVMVCQPHHTWHDLACSILGTFYDDPGSHLYQFLIAADTRPLAHPYDSWVNGRRRYSFRDGDLLVGGPDPEGDDFGCGYDVEEGVDLYPDRFFRPGEPVGATLGVGSFTWFQWDLGSSAFFAVRAVATTPQSPKQDRPFVVAPPLLSGFIGD